MDGGVEVADADWLLMWDLHVMAHVYAARAVVGTMIEAGVVTFSRLSRPPGCSPP